MQELGNGGFFTPEATLTDALKMAWAALTDNPAFVAFMTGVARTSVIDRKKKQQGEMAQLLAEAPRADSPVIASTFEIEREIPRLLASCKRHDACPAAVN